MKTITTLFILTIGVCASFADSLNQVQKTEFVGYYRKWTQMAKEFPDKQEVQVIFVDLDQDGKEEALATYHGNFYETGWSWNAFRQSPDGWKAIEGFDSKTELTNPSSSLFARPGELFQVQIDADTYEFCILAENYDKLAPDGKGSLQKTRFYLDKTGILHQNNISDLERYLAYRTSGAKWPKDTLIKGLKQLHVEVFHEDEASKK